MRSEDDVYEESAYADAKTDVIDELMAQAEAWAAAGSVQGTSG